MRTVFLHGIGQTAADWEETIPQIPSVDADCPEVFSLAEGDLSYAQIMDGLEKRYADTVEPFCLCGLSLGAVLALDYTLRHREKAASLVLIGGQYKAGAFLLHLQNFLFRCMPKKAFQSTGLSKKAMITLVGSMGGIDLRHGLHKIACPVTIVCGAKDYANIRAVKQLKALLPKAELHLIPAVGHEINKHAPQALAAILAAQK